MVEVQRRSVLANIPGFLYDYPVGQRYCFDLIVGHMNNRCAKIAVQPGDFRAGIGGQRVMVGAKSGSYIKSTTSTLDAWGVLCVV